MTAANWSTSGTVDWVTIDFLPGQDQRRQHPRIIDESRVLAMYMNNKAAEAVARGRLDDAYAWVRAAIGQDREYLSAYNTLGVIYQRRGAAVESERALRFALELDPRNTHVLGNLEIALRALGRRVEADEVAAELRRLEPTPPFAFFKEGMQAMQAGDYRKAKRLFEREIRRGVEYHEFHFWLALAHLNLGEVGPAQRELELAREISTTREQYAIYSTKLQRLKSSNPR
jgi:Tfp pilus assembly protein PilF